MPYVALAPADRASRLTAAGGRWRALAGRRPELAPAVALQRDLFDVMLNVLDALEQGHVPRPSIPPRYASAKLGRGVPALAGERVPIPLAILGPALDPFCRALSAGGAGRAADHLRDLLAEGSLDPESLLAASLSRDRQAVLKGSVHRGLSPDLVWLVGELAVSPFAHVLQRAILARGADPSLDSALDAWTHGYCPACGSWAALAEVVADSPVLRCSFCALAWSLPPRQCVYCGSADPEIIDDAEDATRRVAGCRACGGYLKLVDVDGPSPFPLLAIADLETTELDVTAMERGFSRPDLRGGGSGARRA